MTAYLVIGVAVAAVLWFHGFSTGRKNPSNKPPEGGYHHDW